MSTAHGSHISRTTHPALVPTSLAGLALRNRTAVAPMTRVSATADGFATEEMRRYYTHFAEGGFGLIITEGTYPDLAHSQAYPNQPGIGSDEQARAWRPIVESVHAAGGRIVLQLMHAGALVQGNPHRDEALAPSAIQPKGKKMSEYGGGEGRYAMPREMTEQDIADVIEGFSRAAVRAREAGFDGVEIHGANGYLIDQFLTTYTNTRSDRYGGPVENRIRFAVEVAEAVRRAVGPEFVVGLRLSEAKVNDKAYVWPGGEADARIIFAAVRDARVSYVHIAGEGRDFADSAHHGVTLPQLARYIAKVPVIANGALHIGSDAQRVLEDHHADIIALGRAALANPDWPNRLANGTPFEHFDPAILHPAATLQNAAARRAASQ